MSDAMFAYGILSDEDKKLVDELIFRLMPVDDEPMTEADIQAIREAKEEYRNGELQPF